MTGSRLDRDLSRVGRAVRPAPPADRHGCPATDGTAGAPASGPSMTLRARSARPERVARTAPV
jgi:hypothetical protein